MKVKHHRDGIIAKRVIVDGKRMVILGETEFDRLLQRADLWDSHARTRRGRPLSGN